MINQGGNVGIKNKYETYNAGCKQCLIAFSKRFAKDIQGLLLPCF
jgi:hypothetical protein